MAASQAGMSLRRSDWGSELQWQFPNLGWRASARHIRERVVSDPDEERAPLV